MSDLLSRLRIATSYYDESLPPEIIEPVQPTLTSLNPTSIVMGTPTLVTVTGIEFTHSSKIRSAFTDQITTYISPTQLSFMAEADTVGHTTIEVANGELISNSIDLNVTASVGDEEEPPPEEPPPDGNGETEPPAA
jgi:IPT/TIG domain